MWRRAIVLRVLDFCLTDEQGHEIFSTLDVSVDLTADWVTATVPTRSFGKRNGAVIAVACLVVGYSLTARRMETPPSAAATPRFAAVKFRNEREYENDRSQQRRVVCIGRSGPL